jgi:hypothetical protein
MFLLEPLRSAGTVGNSEGVAEEMGLKELNKINKQLEICEFEKAGQFDGRAILFLCNFS